MIYDIVKPNTMVPKGRIDSLEKSLKSVISNNIPGDIVECGTWRGGLAALMLHYIIKNNLSKKLYIYDTFKGMPEPGIKDDARAMEKYSRTRDGEFSDWCRADLNTVKNTLSKVSPNFHEHCTLIEGMVEQTLDNCEVSTIALCRIDTDFYDSTKKEFDVLYPKISVGGYMLVDDYTAWGGCRKAVHEYLATLDSNSYETHLAAESMVIQKIK